MPSSVVALIILSALAHATWNALLKRSRDPENSMVGMMLVCAVSTALVALAVRAPWPPPRSIAFSVVSGVLEAGYFVTLARALARAPLASVYTIVRGGALVIVWPVSMVMLGERVTWLRAAGTVLVITGLAVTSAGERGRATQRGLPALPKGARSGLAIAAVCASFVGGYNLAYKLALSSGGRPETTVALSLSIAMAIQLAFLGRKRARLAWAAARAEPWRTVAAGLLGNVGFLVFLFAMKDAGAGVVTTLRNTSILFAQGLAFLLGERPGRLGVLGALLVTVGAVLLAL